MYGNPVFFDCHVLQSIKKMQHLKPRWIWCTQWFK